MKVEPKVDLETLFFHIDKKIKCSYTRNDYESAFLQFLRAVKYLFQGNGNYLAADRDKPVHLSLPYFRSDVIYKYIPDSTVSINQLGLSIRAKFAGIGSLLILYLKLRKYDSEHKALVVGSILVGYIYYLRIYRNKIRYVSFHFYSFVHDVAALLFILKSSDDHIVSYHEWACFLDETMGVFTDRYVARFELVSDYVESWEAVTASEYTYERSTMSLASGSYCSVGPSQILIGFVSSGFHARQGKTHIDQKLLEEGKQREDELLEMLSDVLADDERYQLYIFHHSPRGVETVQDAERYYGDYLDKNRIFLKSDLCAESISQLTAGFTVISNGFWDFLNAGTKCYLYKPWLSKRQVALSPLKNITVEERLFGYDLDGLKRMIGESYSDYLQRLNGK